jgi:hypothetical protein
MASSTRREFQIGRFAVRVDAAQIDLPGVEGWIGTWPIYEVPIRRGDLPTRYGDTDLQASEDMAIGMARTIAKLMAKTM